MAKKKKTAKKATAKKSPRKAKTSKAAPKKKAIAKKAAPKKAAPKKAAPKKAAPKKAAPKKAAPKKSNGHAYELPAVLAALHEMPFDYDEGFDFEPFDKFLSADESTSWIRAWTGNQELTGDEFRVFGQDGTGGYATFWLVRPDADILEQPIVFFGSEGELGVVAKNFDDYLWVLAHGAGPYEAASYGGETSKPHEGFTSFAEKHAPHAKKTAKHAIDAAKSEFPDFEARIRARVRH